MILALTGFAWAAEGVADRVAALVNEDVITLTEVYDLGRPFIDESCPGHAPRCVWEAEQQVLNSLIMASLVSQELTRLSLSISGEDVDQAIDRVVREYDLADRDALRTEVERSGTSWVTYREQLEQQLKGQRFDQAVLMPRVSVAEDELRDLYQRTARREHDVEVHLDGLGMTVLPEEEADQRADLVALVEELRAGRVTWKEARERFDLAGLGRALDGKAFTPGQLVPEIDEVAFRDPAGSFVGPVQVGSMLAVLYVMSRGETSGDLLPYESVVESLRREVMARKLEDTREEWYQIARRQAAVRVVLPAP